MLIAVHIKPEDAEKELDELYDVFRSVREKWKTEVKHNARPENTSSYIHIFSRIGFYLWLQNLNLLFLKSQDTRSHALFL